MQSVLRSADGRAAGAAVVGVGAALLAVAGTLCCVGPAVVALLGVGGAVAAASLEPYQPWFLALAVLSLSYGFVHACRRKPSCESGDCSVRRSRLIVWIATVVAALAFSSPFLLGWLG